MKKRVGPPTVWCVTDGPGRGVYSVHRTRAQAKAGCYFYGSRPVRYTLVAAQDPKRLRPSSQQTTERRRT